jgi:hypothetical protein
MSHRSISGPYHLVIRRSEYHGILLGAAKRVAHSLGMSDYPAPSTSTNRRQSMKALKIDHEVGRRIWMGLVSGTTAIFQRDVLAWRID